ncbi:MULTISPECIES: hypothetical protein [unclassified Leptospira]|uniref:hypothetical protein n=1 Tax=unclassified Leptospira TaxID=2633828 RepID=UPI0002BE3547|nr:MULTISPECIES: hypothetical protein [unclassified Leptospira]EMJ97194.1 hypothetical protein LEP1GSC192_3565 [Leptospira sp. B5-022]MCR1793281.1 DUF1318 domain-containing protein [Leptospira sp. id769339]
MKNILKSYFILFVIFPLFVYCPIKAPPITFTQTQTAAEKQMLGEDRNLEKDGWLIASIKTSSSGSEIWEKDLIKEEFGNTSDNQFYMALRILAYLARELREYRSLGVLAEGIDGKVRWNPKIREAGAGKISQDPKQKSRIDDIVKLTNENREIVIKEKLKKVFGDPNRSLTEKEKTAIKESVQTTWVRSVDVGEYYEVSAGNWKKKE